MNKMIIIFIFYFLLMSHDSLSAVELNDSTVIHLNEVRVDASRESQFPGTGKVLQAYTSETILKTPAQTLDAFMKSIPGVDVRQRGVGGTQADISIRGGSFDQVLVLLNGVNITDQQTGHHNLNIPVELSEVASIEVLQGSAARRYGSQAFSGAINIVTNPERKNKIELHLTGGSFDTYGQKLTIATGRGNLNHFTTVSHQSSPGYRENTDYDIYNLFTQTNIATNNAGKFDFQLGYQQKSFGANSFYTQEYPNQFEHTRTQFASLNWEKQIKKLYVAADVQYRRHYDRFELFRDFQNKKPWYADHNYHLTDVAGGSLHLEYTGRFGKIDAGVSSRYDHIYSTVLGSVIADTLKHPVNHVEKGMNKKFNKEADRLLNTAYFDYSKGLGAFYFSAGTSFSHTRKYGFKHHWGADLSYVPNQHWTVYTSINTASRLPTFTDLYYQNSTHNANPDIKPESSFTSEAGVKYVESKLNLQAGGFYRRGNNIIDWVRYSDQDKWESMNQTELNTSGMNISAGYTFSNSFLKNIFIAYSYIHTDKQADGYDSKYALDYLKHQLIFSLHHQLLKNLTVSWNAGYHDRAGSYIDFDSGALTDYSPYLLAGCRIAWDKSAFLIYADVNNLLNESYVDYGGLIQPGIYGNLGVRLKY
jgi:iron complex outermembrane receptor protein